MSSWVNVGAKNILAGTDIPTKKALKELFATDAANVGLYATDVFGEFATMSWFGDNLEIGVKYSVAGPNPYTSRKWYATVEKTAKGIKVS